MSDLGVQRDDGCLHATKEIAKLVDSGNRSVGDRVTAFELLERFRNLTSKKSQSVFGLLLHSLNDPDPMFGCKPAALSPRWATVMPFPISTLLSRRNKDENTRTTLTIKLSELWQKMKR